MKPTALQRRLALLLPLLCAGVACHDDPGTEVVIVTETVPAYVEWEPNDDAFDANDFGVLHPGDLFLIDGHSTDDGSDPFDGFAFVAGSPVHVDFRLFDEPYSSDLDVWLYDAQLEEVVGYYETENHPEAGGVDVVDAGLEFHLLVTSYLGTANYTLEIEVSPLAVAYAAAEQGQSSLRASGGASSSATRERSLLASDYVLSGEGRNAPITLEQELDAETGFLLEILRLPARAIGGQ